MTSSNCKLSLISRVGEMLVIDAQTKNRGSKNFVNIRAQRFGFNSWTYSANFLDVLNTHATPGKSERLMTFDRRQGLARLEG